MILRAPSLTPLQLGVAAAAAAALLLLVRAHGQALGGAGRGGAQQAVSGVSSFNGRTGSVVAQANDYSFAMLSGSAAAGQLPPLSALNGSIHLSQIASAGGSTGQVVCWDGAGYALCSLQQIAGLLNLSQLAQNGASAGNAPLWGGSAWAPGVPSGGGGGGGGSVTGVFGRTGSVVAQTGDYSYAQISGTPVFADQIIPAGAIDGVNQTFTLPDAPVSGSVYVWRNGVLMQRGEDYSISGATIYFFGGSTPAPGDTLLVSYRK